MKTILTIDGGGIRGIIPAMALQSIEKRLRAKTGQLFDMIAGTSTGGILGSALSVGIPATQVLGMYKEHGPFIFHRSLGWTLKTANGHNGPKYPSVALRTALRSVLGPLTMRHVDNPLMLTAWDLTRESTVFIKSWHNQSTSLVDACLATSAAPTYFAPHQMPRSDSALADGGLYCNNPTAAAHASAIKLWPGEDIHVISIGTGLKPPPENPISWARACSLGKVRWIAIAIEAMMQGQSQAVHYQMTQQLGDRYTRLQIATDCMEMDNASQSNMEDLREVGKALSMSPVYKKVLRTLKLRRLNRKLSEHRDYVTFT